MTNRKGSQAGPRDGKLAQTLECFGCFYYNHLQEEDLGGGKLRLECEISLLHYKVLKLKILETRGFFNLFMV